MEQMKDEAEAVSIFGVAIKSRTPSQFSAECEQSFTQGNFSSIATVNPEILLQAKKEPRFLYTLQSCTFRVVDGFGISLITLFKKGKFFPRITGNDAVVVLTDIAHKHNLCIGIVGGSQRRAGEAVEFLQRAYPGVTWIDLMSGHDCEVTRDGEFVDGADFFYQGMEQHKPEILLAAFGAQKQESFLLHIPERYPFVRFGIGIGGLVDVWSGHISRPPRFFSSFGLEWLWRLVQEPKRFTRIWNAVIVFPIQSLFFDTRS